MTTFLTILVVIAAVILTLVVLAQNPKGSGLSSAFGGSGASNQLMGVQRTTDILEKTTWGLAIFILVICLFMNFFYHRGAQQAQEGKLERQLQQAPPPTQQRTPQIPKNVGQDQQQTSPPTSNQPQQQEEQQQNQPAK